MNSYPIKTLSNENAAKLDNLYSMMEQESERFLGYPCNGVFDYTPLYRFLKYPINNIGDPFLPSNYHLNTHEFECEVLSLFAKLTEAPTGSTWGYITNGGTEGNMYGIFLARETLPDGIVYYSEDTHYSVDKILRCLHIRSIMIRSKADGTMDLDDLRETIKIHRDVPPIVFANIGTTMKGAVDDIQGIQQIFKDLAIRKHYIHADAALSGMILPFVDNPPAWNFKAGIDSISISGHKMVGSPIPCGVVLAKKTNVDLIAQSVEYIGTLDTTMMGSRNAITPLFLWYAFNTVGIEGFRQIIQDCFAVADYAIEKLNQIGRNAWRYSYSNTVVFDRPKSEITTKWQLAPNQNITHLLAMPHVTRDRIDELVADILASEQEIKIPAVLNDTKQPVTTELKSSSSPLRQITMICPSQEELISEISRAIASANINIESFDATSLDNTELIRMSVDDYDLAIQILSKTSCNGRLYGQADIEADPVAKEILSEIELQPISEQALLVEIEDRPGALAALTQRFHDAELNPRNVRILYRSEGKGVVAIATDNLERAKSVFQDMLK